MTGFKSKKTAALDEEGMYLVHQTDWDKANAARGQANLVNGRYILAQPAQEPVEEDDDTQVYGDALTIAYQSGYRDGNIAYQSGYRDGNIAYQSGYRDGKKAALAGREWNFCERCGKRTADLTVIHTCTPPQDKNNG